MTKPANNQQWVPSARYFAAADHFRGKGMTALARKMLRKGNDALRAELVASTQRLRERVNRKEST